MSKGGREGRRVASVLLLSATLLQTGCLIVGNRGPTKGDIALQWGFEDAGTCASAGVETVIVTIRGQDSGEFFDVAMDCLDGGGTFTDFLAGRYTVHLEGVAYDGDVLYATTRSIDVDGGEITDLGLVVMASTLPPVTEGSLAVDWSFYFPSSEPTLDCSYAGVDYVAIYITDSYGQAVFDQSVRCLDGPAIIDYLNEGVYGVELFGLGSYRGRTVTLYESGAFSITVLAGQLTDVGIIDLDRVPGQFGDIEVGWTFSGNNSCAAAGVQWITIKTYRLAPDLLDDEITVDCADEPQLRTTFVPGDYGVEVEGWDAGDNLTWYGYLEFPLAPGGFADVTVQTAPN